MQSSSIEGAEQRTEAPLAIAERWLAPVEVIAPPAIREDERALERRYTPRWLRVELTPMQRELVWLLARRPGHVWRYGELVRALWSAEDALDPYRRLQQLVSATRGRIEKDPRSPRYLISTYGVGYRFYPTGYEPGDD